MTQPNRPTSYRIVDSSEITDPLRDLRRVIILLAKGVAVDFAGNCFHRSGKKSDQFSAHERLFLLYLAFDMLHKPEKWLSKDELIDRLNGSMKNLVNKLYPLPKYKDTYSPASPEHAIEQVAYSLRRKLGEDCRNPVFILSVRNLGYKLEAEPDYGYALIRVRH